MYATDTPRAQNPLLTCIAIGSQVSCPPIGGQFDCDASKQGVYDPCHRRAIATLATARG